MPASDGLFVPFDGAQGTSPTEARLALGALLATTGATSSDVRAGILWAPGNQAGAAASEPGRVTGSTSTAPWRYGIRACHLVGVRSVDLGPYLWTIRGTTWADTDPAPGSGSRWDLIWSRQGDFGQGDAASSAVTGVTRGAVDATSPTKPYADVPVGAVVLAEALVAAGATNTAHANVTISMVAPFTALRGTPMPVRNQTQRDAISRYPGLEVLRLDVNGWPVEQWNGSAWFRPARIDQLETGAVSPIGAFSNAGNGGFASISVTKDALGRVQWHGELNGTGGGVADQHLATVPVGFRPSAAEPFLLPTRSGNGFPAVPVFVNSAGQLRVMPNVSWSGSITIGLSTIAYQAA